MLFVVLTYLTFTLLFESLVVKNKPVVIVPKIRVSAINTNDINFQTSKEHLTFPESSLCEQISISEHGSSEHAFAEFDNCP